MLVSRICQNCYSDAAIARASASICIATARAAPGSSYCLDVRCVVESHSTAGDEQGRATAMASAVDMAR